MNELNAGQKKFLEKYKITGTSLLPEIAEALQSAYIEGSVMGKLQEKNEEVIKSLAHIYE